MLNKSIYNKLPDRGRSKKSRKKTKAKENQLRALVGGKTKAETARLAIDSIKNAGEHGRCDPTLSFQTLANLFASRIACSRGQRLEVDRLWNRFMSMAREAGELAVDEFLRADSRIDYKMAFQWMLAGRVGTLLEIVSLHPDAVTEYGVFENSSGQLSTAPCRKDGSVISSDELVPLPSLILPNHFFETGEKANTSTLDHCTFSEPDDDFKDRFRKLAYTSTAAKIAAQYSARKQEAEAKPLAKKSAAKRKAW
ncbi:MAG: hypothetical protein EXS19_04250 [Pedosphaera sp.]|nr:hypothetical protein [Pedosphaera sp.]